MIHNLQYVIAALHSGLFPAPLSVEVRVYLSSSLMDFSLNICPNALLFQLQI